MQHGTKSHQRHNQSVGYDDLVRLAIIIIFILTLTVQAKAQWQIEDSHTTASLRGIDSVGDGIAWASGTNGTILRTQDDGNHWQACAIPPGAEKLDFRGVQAFDANTAIVMSSGKGDLSRLYKTTDGCQTWRLVFTNPDPEGFWDAVKFTSGPNTNPDMRRYRSGVVIGDSVNGKLPEFFSSDSGEHWRRGDDLTLASTSDGESLFAASNSSLLYFEGQAEIFVTGGTRSRSRILWENIKHDPHVSWKYVGGDIPLSNGLSAGAFSIATSFLSGTSWKAADSSRFISFPPTATCVAVGGDYKKSEKTSGTAAFSTDGGLHWNAAQTPPHGFRSAVAYDPQQKLWITVGPNGTDISRDNGRNWTALKPTKEDAPDADKNWNALSLPFVVGPNGRIGKLRLSALKP